MSSKQRRRYTKEYKLEVVRLLESGERTAVELSRELEIHENTLYKWRRQLGSEGDNAFPGNGRQNGQEAELALLRRKLAKAEMERDILKKAVGIFSRVQR